MANSCVLKVGSSASTREPGMANANACDAIRWSRRCRLMPCHALVLFISAHKRTLRPPASFHVVPSKLSRSQQRVRRFSRPGAPGGRQRVLLRPTAYRSQGSDIFARVIQRRFKRKVQCQHHSIYVRPSPYSDGLSRDHSSLFCCWSTMPRIPDAPHNPSIPGAPGPQK